MILSCKDILLDIAKDRNNVSRAHDNQNNYTNLIILSREIHILLCVFYLQRPDDHRRKWNREEYERIALQRLQEEIAEEELGLPKQPAVKRELLKQRDYKVDLESKLGKSVVINKNTPSSQTGGYNGIFKYLIKNLIMQYIKLK